jgi:uncharacterized protein
MKSREFDPLRLDVEAFAKADGSLDGAWPLKDLNRLAESTLAPVADALEEPVQWSVRGERREPRAAAPQSVLHVEASTKVWLECQRCLQPVLESLRSSRSFLFVEGEEAAAELDAASEEDVLALSRAFNAQELLEEELLLSLPLVPKHDVCPQPLAAPEDDLPTEEAPHPFAALAALKRGGLPN